MQVFPSAPPLPLLLSLPLLVLLLLLLPCEASNNDGGGRWRGASCCGEAVVPYCAVGCKRATSVAGLESHCRRSHEAELYNCLSDQKRTKNGKANHFIEDDEVQEVVTCCQRAGSAQCQTACQQLQRAAPGEREAALTRLQDTACGQEDAEFWECHGGGPPAPARPGHRLELHCCPLADTDQCRSLCSDTYSLRWHDQGPRFETRCLDAQFGETRMLHCIRDAEEPCLPSSGRLQFCEDFTDGSTSLYRRWDQNADINAKNDFIVWMRSGALGLSFRNLSIVTTGHCKTDLRRLSCLLHLRPCRRSDHHPAQICRSDCVRLLNSCLSKGGGEADTEALCKLISAPEPDCVVIPETSPQLPPNSVQPLQLPQQQQQRRHQVSSPCLPSPCGTGMVCRVGAPNHSTYICLPGCRLSTVSGRMVALGSSVLLPPVGGAGNRLSLLLCAPAADGGAPKLTRCASVTVPHRMTCDAFGRKIDSGTMAHRGCLSCVCVDGDLLCRTAHECLKATQAPRPAGLAQQPPCVHVHSLGSAYQRCAASSLAYDPCEVRPCAAGHRCEPRPDFCVDGLQPCALHTCVPETAAAIANAAETCQQSQASAVSVEESVWHQPFVACPAPAAECDALPPPCPGGNASVLPSCGSTLRLYFSRRRLAALGSPVPARAVLSALRRLVGTADCALTGRLEVARQLTVVVRADRAAAAAVCRLEADKLRVWLSSGSPATAADPALWPVVYAELVPDPVRSSGAAAAGRPPLLLLLLAVAAGMARAVGEAGSL